MPSVRSVLHDIAEKDLNPNKAYKVGKDGTLKAAGKPVIEIQPEPPVQEPEVFGKPAEPDLEPTSAPMTVPEPSLLEAQDTATFQDEKLASEVGVTDDPQPVISKKRSKKNSVDL